MSNNNTEPPLLLPDDTPRSRSQYAVILSENTLSTKSDALIELAKTEVGPDFILDTAQQKSSRIQKVFFVLILGLTLFLVYRYFPRPVPPVELKNEFSFQDMPSSVAKPFRKAVDAAQDARDKGHYHECIKILQPYVDELLKNKLNQKNIRDNQLIFAYYLDSAWQIRKVSSGTTEKTNSELISNAGKLNRILIQHDPDTIQWHLLKIALTMDSQLLNWNTPRIKQDPAMVKRIDSVLKTLESVETRLNQSNMDKNVKKENLAMLELWRAQLLVSRWKYAAKKLSRDDYGNPGVADREKACDIAELYDNVLDFLKLRKHIVDLMIANNSGYYYWRGEKLWRKKFLKEEQKRLSIKIKNAEKKKRIGGEK